MGLGSLLRQRRRLQVQKRRKAGKLVFCRADAERLVSGVAQVLGVALGESCNR